MIKKDVLKYGMTPNCKGCEAVNRCGIHRNHSEMCREKMMKRLEEDGEEIIENLNEDRTRMGENRKKEEEDE